MLIALFGLSSVGKSTLARELSRQFEADLRGCGDIVRACAAAKGGDLAAVTQDEHREIDDATRLWCQSPESRIVEGRYLDQVLQAFKRPMTLVEIVASEEVRRVRWADRLGRSISASDVRTFDEEDAAFRVRNYGDAARLPANHVLNTSDRSVGSCLEQLASLVGWAPPG